MVVNKREIWMDADEFVTRYEKRNQAYLEEQSEENNEEFTED